MVKWAIASESRTRSFGVSVACSARKGPRYYPTNEGMRVSGWGGEASRAAKGGMGAAILYMCTQ